MFLYFYIGFLACVLSLPNVAFSDPVSSTPDEEEIFAPYDGQRYDSFDWNLLKALDSPELGNVIVSPVSVKILMAILYEGAKGTTEKELEATMEFPVSREAVRDRFSKILASLQPATMTYTLNLGTKVFLDSSLVFNDRFANRTKQYYGGELDTLDFNDATATCNTINDWVSKYTSGKITNIVTEDDLKESILLLVNALYFKGKWRTQFPRNRTTPGGFYVTPQSTVSVDYMSNNGRYYYSDSSELDAKILRLPFKGSHISMYFVLPNAKAGLRRLIRNMNPMVLKRHLWLMDQLNVEVILPKFKFDYKSLLGKILQKMGLQQIFQNNASLGRIAKKKKGSTRISVSNVLQKAGIEINEEGSVAYAATEIILGNKFGSPDYIFNASNPFMFFIEDEQTGTVLFAGKVENPVQIDEVPFPPELSLPTRFGSTTENPSQQTTEIPAVASVPQVIPQVMHLTPTDNVELTNYRRFHYFDIELFKTVASKNNANILISPASIKQVLAMVLEGANGQCAEEVRNALRLPHDKRVVREQFHSLLEKYAEEQSGVQLELANRIFISNKATPVRQYQDVLRKYYSSDVEPVDFSSPYKTANLINDWVNRVTHGLIPTLLSSDSIKPETSVILSNALYFKGTWEKAFSESGTLIRCFQPTPGQCYNTYMMDTMDTFNFAEVKELDAKALEMPYKDRKFSMLILLPNKMNGIKQLVRDLPYAPMDKIVEKLEMTDVLVGIPRFQIEYSEDLARHLEEVEITEIFSEQRANLSGIVSGKNDLFISNVLHKTKIEVNEQGTIAAASTGAVVIPLMGSSKPRFRADHPFVFFIRHIESGTILFAGRVSEPEKAEQEPTTSTHVSRKEKIPQDSYSQNVQAPIYQQIPQAPQLYSPTSNRQGQQGTQNYNVRQEQTPVYQPTFNSQQTYNKQQQTFSNEQTENDGITFPKKN